LLGAEWKSQLGCMPAFLVESVKYLSLKNMCDSLLADARWSVKDWSYSASCVSVLVGQLAEGEDD